MKKKCKWAYVLVLIAAAFTLAQAILYTVLFNRFRNDMRWYFFEWRGKGLDIAFMEATMNPRVYPRWFLEEGVHIFFCVAVLSMAMVQLYFAIVAQKRRSASICSIVFCSLPNVAMLFLFSSLSAYTAAPLLVLNILGNVKLISVHNENKKAAAVERASAAGSGEAARVEGDETTRRLPTDIQFEDVIIGEKEWKSFRKTASQEELFALAVGAKFMTSGKKFFIKALISVLGTILSIVVGLCCLSDGFFGVAIILGGYLAFNGMAVTLTSYASTLKDCYKKLNEENKAYVDSFGEDKPFIKVLKTLVEIGLLFFTLPYRAILMVIATALPSAEEWCIAHGGLGGVVVTLPKGYDIGGLREVGEYYRSRSFSDALIESGEQAAAEQSASMQSYSYQDETGVTQTAYSSDGKNFYSSADKTNKIGESADGGKTIDFSKK